MDPHRHKNRKPRYGFYAWPYLVAVTAVGSTGTAILLLSNSVPGWLSMAGASISAIGFYLALAHYLSVKLSLRKENVLARELLAFLAPSRRETVLDVGSGTGRTSIALTKNRCNERVVGIDIYSSRTLSGNSPRRALENALIEGVRERVHFNRGDVLHAPFRSESFDAVTAGSVLHLFTKKRQELALSEMLRALKDGGRLILIEWLRTPKTVLLYLLPALFVFQTENYWRRLLEKHGLRNIKIARIGNIALIGGQKRSSVNSVANP